MQRKPDFSGTIDEAFEALGNELELIWMRCGVVRTGHERWRMRGASVQSGLLEEPIRVMTSCFLFSREGNSLYSRVASKLCRESKR